jgi:hypothetical protein
MKNINKIVFLLFCIVFALSSCKKDEIIVKTNGEKNAEELQKIINNDKDPTNFDILVVNDGGVFTDVENVWFENHYMVYSNETYSKHYYDLNNMLYFEFQYIDKDSRRIIIYF